LVHFFFLPSAIAWGVDLPTPFHADPQHKLQYGKRVAPTAAPRERLAGQHSWNFVEFR
jgi:hypothetical protein